MNRQNQFEVMGVLILISVIAVVAVFVNYTEDEAGGIHIKINASQAVEIVAQDPVVQEYISANFKRPEWRVVNATLVQDSLYDVDVNVIQEGQPYWKVEMLERTCACAGIRDLYVVEGYVSPVTGELINITTGTIRENQYDKETCASTVCH